MSIRWLPSPKKEEALILEVVVIYPSVPISTRDFPMKKRCVRKI
jgi:hypothetical protein